MTHDGLDKVGPSDLHSVPSPKLTGIANCRRISVPITRISGRSKIHLVFFSIIE